MYGLAMSPSSETEMSEYSDIDVFQVINITERCARGAVFNGNIEVRTISTSLTLRSDMALTSYGNQKLSGNPSVSLAPSSQMEEAERTDVE